MRWAVVRSCQTSGCSFSTSLMFEAMVCACASSTADACAFTAAGNSSPSRNACHPTLPIRQTLAETAVHTIRYFQRETLARKRRRESRLPQNITAVRPIASTAVGTRISRMRVRKVFAYASTVYSPNGRKTQAEEIHPFFLRRKPRLSASTAAAVNHKRMCSDALRSSPASGRNSRLRYHI